MRDVPSEFDTEEGVRQLFEPIGNIVSTYVNPSAKGNMYFLTFGSENKEDREYGPRCAEKAVQEMHGRIYPSAAKPLYVAEVIKKD